MMHANRSSRSRSLAALLTAGLLLAGFTGARAQLAPSPAAPKGQGPYPNFDLRENGAAAARAKSGAAQRQDARATLASRVPSLQTELNAFGSAIEIVSGNFLTAASAAPRAETLRNFLAENGALYGLSASEVAALIPFADQANPGGGMSWVGLKQELDGVPVFQAELTAGFSRDGALARTAGNLVPGLTGSVVSTLPTLSAAEVVARGSATIGRRVDAARLTVLSSDTLRRTSDLAGGPYTRATRTELVFFPVAPGEAVLAYAMTLWDRPSAYYLLVNANDGTLLWRKNITDDQTQAVTYNVYTGASPSEYNPTAAVPGQGFQAPGVARVDVTLISDSAPASPLGWITDLATPTTTVTTTGNNCDAGLDVDSTNGIDAGSRPTSNTRTFSFNYAPAPLGAESPRTAASRSGAITNLFFWTNRYHDTLWNLGFTESFRNFQTTNVFNSVDRGGAGNDAVSAQVQDTADATAPNYNNANFSTPADGGPGVMQMYLFNSPNPNRDGDLDGEVFLHELTHGTSNRLHNNGSGLTTYTARGMGEGWSDYYARCLLAKPSEDVSAVFETGGYVTYQLSGLTDNYYYGIRRFPYAVITNVANGKPHNPLTLADIDAGRYQITDGAYPPSPIFAAGGPNEVHNIGEVWCMMLLEMRARFINRLGFATGNQRALQVVTDGMKGDGINPTILVARDSLITAATAANPNAAGAADAKDIRLAFAARGAGAGATLVGSGTNGINIAVTESFLPDLALGAVSFTDALGNNNGTADPGEDIVLSVALGNPLTAANPAVTARVGFYTADYGQIAAGGTVTRTFAYRVPATALAGQLLSVPITVSSAAGEATAAIPLRVGAVSPFLIENFDGTTGTALPAGWTSAVAGATTAVAWVTSTAGAVDVGRTAFCADPTGTGTTASTYQGGESSLISPAITLPAGGSQLTFKHRYLFEGSVSTPYDGGVLEIKIGAGAFTDIIAAGGSFAQGPYTVSIVSQGTMRNPISNRCGWAGSANTVTTNTVVNLPPAAAGQSVQFRWRLGFDYADAGTGWYVDTVGLNKFTTAAIDTDGDGLPDGYETANGLDPNQASDAALDSDGDGVSNLNEYRAGTDPRSAASVLKISATTRDAGAGLVTVTFPSVNGKSYVLEYKTDLTAATWTPLVTGIAGTGADLSVVEPGPDTDPRRFFRVRAQ